MSNEERKEALRDLRSKLQCLDYSVSQDGDKLQVFKASRAVSVKEIKKIAREEIPTYTKVLDFSVKVARFFYVEVSLS